MVLTGVCLVKPEFIVEEHISELSLNCVSDKDKESLKNEESNNSEREPPEKKQRLSKAEKKKLRGQNKARPATFRRNRELELCNTLINVTKDNHPPCNKNNCGFMHDVQEYLKNKPEDIGLECYNFRTAGVCSRGLTCRYGKEHITPEGWNVTNEEKQRLFNAIGLHTFNQLPHDLQNSLRKRLYNFSLAEAVVKYNDKQRDANKEANKSTGDTETPITQEKVIDQSLSDHVTGDPEFQTKQSETKVEIKKQFLSGSVTDEDVIKLLQREKRKIDWKGKLFLSPLTTVGNLPFRRICKEFGADVTCGEMAMCSSLLQGTPQEWALVKRHHTENIFGVQLCANNPHLLAKCGQLLENEINIDFIDLNLGCPIELVYREGGGCGLLRRPRVLEACVRSLSQILTIPLTVKTRTGVYSNESIAHNLIPKFRDWGASLVTIHGRSREQRYTKLADWPYIRQCAQAAAPLPLLGNGDILSYEDYKTALESCPELAGVMIGRGGLIKPWIFTEIKEQKLWDISSSERFDIMKKYVNYGLEHWGSDTKGVENTRRFLLEWQSFLYRYIPVGILEKPPQKVNERPPRFHGRDDLETLMASPAASDWIKLSEMLLGPVPDGFQFLPKHKANSYT